MFNIQAIDKQKTISLLLEHTGYKPYNDRTSNTAGLFMSDTNSITNTTQISSLSPKETEKFNRLFWHSRRGMLELDVLLVPFLKEAYLDLPEDDQIRYENLLECEDPDLFSWFLRNGKPENLEHQKIVKIILDRIQVN